MSWFAVRCIFHDQILKAYEERITIWQANDAEAAIALAEGEAAEYARDSEMNALEFAQTFEFSDELRQGTEVFSLFRSSSLDADDYLDRFFDSGHERQNHLG